MKLRLSLLVVLVGVMSTGCSRYFMQKDKFDAVKKVAVVSYTIDPHMLLGTASADDAKFNTAAKNVETIVKNMSGGEMVVVPAAEVMNNEKYKAMGKEAIDGYYTAKGMRILTEDSEQLNQATITPDTAKQLAEALGVDGVVLVHDSWGMEQYALGFKGRTRNNYSFTMFDKDGTKVWSDTVSGSSEEGFPLAAGVIATDVDNWVVNNNQSLEAAMVEAKKHMGK